ncbi:MAG: tetratricopeptide repeat protein, partial [Kiritimatiellae bacterium]|nr:tetratricopeptide repeat protein [Kiritimatiellia bacterium]
MNIRYWTCGGLMLCLLTAAPCARAADEVESVVGLSREAEAALAAGDTAKALELSQRAIALDPAYAPGWRGAGQALLRGGKPAEAAPSLERAVALDPDHPMVRREWSVALWDSGRTDDALRVIQEHLKRFPDDLAARRDQAAWLNRAGRVDEAMSAYEIIAQADPEDPVPWRERGAMLYREDRNEEAVAMLREALARKPDDGLAHKDLGWALLAMQNRPEGLAELREAVMLNVPNSDALLIQVAAHMIEDHEADEAIAFVRRERPGQPLAPSGIELINMGRWVASEPFLREALVGGEDPGETGLYLCHVLALSGRESEIPPLLKPVLDRPADQWTDHDRDLLAETLGACGSAVMTEEVAARADQIVGERPQADRKITEALERAADEFRVRHDPARALRLYRRVQERNPNSEGWVWAVSLIEQTEGPKSALEALTAWRSRATSPAVCAGMDGWKAEMEGQWEDAVKNFGIALDGGLDAPLLHQRRFRSLLKLGRIAEARTVAESLNERVEAGHEVFRSYVAEMWTAIDERSKALHQWTVLRAGHPDQPYYTIEMASMLYRMGRAEEARDLLAQMNDAVGDPRIYELRSEIESALGRYREAADCAREGLERAPSRNLLRYRAENLEMAGDPEGYPDALACAMEYLKQDPGYEPMALLAGRMMEATGDTDAARAHYEELCTRSPAFAPALRAARDLAARTDHSKEAAEWALQLAESRPGDPEVMRRLALSLAEHDRFPSALSKVRHLSRFNPKRAVPVLLYNDPVEWPYAGRVRVEQMVGQLRKLAEEKFKVVSSPDEPSGKEPRVMVIVRRGSNAAVQALEPVLKELGGQAAYAADDDQRRGASPGYPDEAELTRMTESGAWRVMSSGPAPRPRAKLGESGATGRVWTHRLPQADGTESRDQYKERVTQALSASAPARSDTSKPMLVYPEGDDGTHSLGVLPGDPEVLRSAAAASFSKVFRDDPAGFHVPGLTPAESIPALTISPSWDADRLLQHLREQNPIAMARLDLAKILYWNRQLESAEEQFAQLDEVGVDRADLRFNRGANALMMGDLRHSRIWLSEAKELSPEDPKIDRSLEEAETRRKPVLSLYGEHWWDNEDRKGTEYGLGADVPVG